MTPRYSKAIALAAKAHEGQNRKGTAIPYITHPVAVAGLVARYGGDEDQQIAGLLHDVLEDAGPAWRPAIDEFGARVLAIVEACTDGTPDPVSGKKAPWKERKQAYLAHLAETPDDALLVSACDKLHNAESILLDLTESQADAEARAALADTAARVQAAPEPLPHSERGAMGGRGKKAGDEN